MRRRGRALPEDRRARAAAVLAAYAAFAHVLAERTAVIPRVRPYQPGQFYLCELPPLRAVLDGLSSLGLLVVDGWPIWTRRPTRPGCACARRVRHPGDRGGQVQVPHGYPRGAGRAQILGTPVVRHCGRDTQRRRGESGPAHGRALPAARRPAPRRYPCAGRPARNQHDRPSARLTHADARNAADADASPLTAPMHKHTVGRALDYDSGRPAMRSPLDNRAPPSSPHGCPSLRAQKWSI